MKFYIPKQVAKQLGVSIYTIYRYVKARKIRAIKYTARNFRIEESELKRFVKIYLFDEMDNR